MISDIEAIRRATKKVNKDINFQLCLIRQEKGDKMWAPQISQIPTYKNCPDPPPPRIFSGDKNKSNNYIFPTRKLSDFKSISELPEDFRFYNSSELEELKKKIKGV